MLVSIAWTQLQQLVCFEIPTHASLVQRFRYAQSTQTKMFMLNAYGNRVGTSNKNDTPLFAPSKINSMLVDSFSFSS